MMPSLILEQSVFLLVFPASNMAAMLMAHREDVDQWILINIVALPDAKHLPFCVNIIAHDLFRGSRIREDDFDFHGQSP
jgi:hypothetical protein